MPKAGSHEENRNRICLLCFGKTKKMYPVKGMVKDLLENHLVYDENDERLPCVVCTTCYNNLYQVKNGEEQIARLPNFADLKILQRSTRSNVNVTCQCHICELARKPKVGNFAIGNHLPKRQSILRDLSNNQASSKLNHIVVNIGQQVSSLKVFLNLYLQTMNHGVRLRVAVDIVSL